MVLKLLPSTYPEPTSMGTWPGLWVWVQAQLFGAHGMRPLSMLSECVLSQALLVLPEQHRWSFGNFLSVLSTFCITRYWSIAPGTAPLLCLPLPAHRPPPIPLRPCLQLALESYHRRSSSENWSGRNWQGAPPAPYPPPRVSLVCIFRAPYM